MQLFSADTTIFKKKHFAYENMKKPPSKVAHYRPQFFLIIANRPKTSPNLNFCTIKIVPRLTYVYSHLSNNCGGWNKRGGGAKVAKSINVEVGINVEGEIFWKKVVHKWNKREVEGGKNLRNQ